MTLEIRLHGRGGQGGVTCAKLVAAIYARLGKSVQTFGDYAGERSGAPVRAYTRVAEEPIANRNKVYAPAELLVLDPSLLGDETVAGLIPGGLLLLNTPEPPAAFAERFGRFRMATIDPTEIARRHGIGTRSVVIVNTTISGAYVRAVGLPWAALEGAYRDLHLARDLPAAREAYEAVALGEARTDQGPGRDAYRRNGKPGRVKASAPRRADVIPLTEHTVGPPTGLKTGSWRTQTPAYVEGLAPCNAWCPAGNGVVRFIQAIAKDDPAAAARILGRTQPLASVCGRVCPAPCMEGCNRREYDGAVDIRGLERWIGDLAPAARRAGRSAGTQRRVAVVGSGPAGLGAAFELARAGHRVTLFERENALGGVLRTGIPSYRLPRSVLDREIGVVLKMGVEPRCGEFLDRDGIDELGSHFDAVILAAGLARARSLDIPGAELRGVEQGLRFLHRVNLEGGAYVSGHALVLGGGNTAMDCARSALRAGAGEVTVAYRRTRSDMPAIAEEIEEARREGIAFRTQSQAVAFHGEGRVVEVELAEVELGDPDDTGRKRPIVTGRTSRVPCDHVFLALGRSADLSLLPEGAEIVQGRVLTAAGATHLFVAGDFATGEGTVAHAIGDGRRAAGRVLVALGEEATVFARPDRASAVPLTAIRRDHFTPRRAARAEVAPVESRVKGFAETNLGLTSAVEAERCFSCGHCTRCDTCLVYCPEGIIRRIPSGYEVDLGFCKGCGICVAECPRGAMEMTSL